MQINLTVVGGVHNGRIIPIKGPEFLIGRDPKCQLRPTSSEIGREHCALVVRDDVVFVRDYEVRQGTLVNGRLLLGGELQLEDGDTIKVGPLTFQLNLAVESSLASSETDDDLLIASVLSETSPEETLLASKPTPRPSVKKPGDERELLCLD